MKDLISAPSVTVTITKDLVFCVILTVLSITSAYFFYHFTYYVIDIIFNNGNGIGMDVVFNIKIISPCVSFLLISIICYLFPRNVRPAHGDEISISCEKIVFSYKSVFFLFISLSTIISYQFVLWSAAIVNGRATSVPYGPKDWTHTTIFIVLLVAPLSEEVFFRFTLWRSISNKFLMPHLITFWLFLLYHYTVGIQAVLLALIPSVILTLLRHLNRGIVYSSIAHITNNASRYILFSGMVVFN